METQVVRQTTSKENTGDTLLSEQVWEVIHKENSTENQGTKRALTLEA